MVGSLLKILTEQFNYNCYWEHVGDDPTNEVEFVKKFKPILQQNNSRIDAKWKLYKEGKPEYYHNPNSDIIIEAERSLTDLLIDKCRELNISIE